MCSRVGQFWLLVAIGRGSLILDTFQSEGLATARSGSLGAVMHAQIKVAPNGPELPFASRLEYCGLSLHSRHSLRARNLYNEEWKSCGLCGRVLVGLLFAQHRFALAASILLTCDPIRHCCYLLHFFEHAQRLREWESQKSSASFPQTEQTYS